MGLTIRPPESNNTGINRTFNLVLPNELGDLPSGHPAVSNIYTAKVRGPGVAALYELQIISRTLELIFDLFVIIFWRNSFNMITLPTNFLADYVTVLFDVPWNVGTETNRTDIESF